MLETRLGYSEFSWYKLLLMWSTRISGLVSQSSEEPCFPDPSVKILLDLTELWQLPLEAGRSVRHHCGDAITQWVLFDSSEISGHVAVAGCSLCANGLIANN